MGRTIQEAGGFNQPPDSQPKSTTGNHSQQLSIPECIGALKEPVFVDMAIIKMCRDELDAVNLCIDLSRMSDEAICQYLGIDKGHWSRIRKGRAHFPTKKRLELMYLAGNWAPLQYELFKSNLLERLKKHLAPEAKQDDGFSAWMAAA